MARTDYSCWTVLAGGGVQTGSVESDLVAATGEHSSMVPVPPSLASGNTASTVK